jgi:hypothetical protein
MPARAKPGKSVQPSQTEQPAKGGTEPASGMPKPSGDSPKPHGDPLMHVIEDE